MTADKAEKTCFDILRGKGIGIQPGGQNLTIRLESVRKPLNTLREGKPQFQISPRCEMLRKGFLGCYQYRRVKVSGSAERYHDEPEKNEYSRPHMHCSTLLDEYSVMPCEDGRSSASSGAALLRSSTPRA